MNLLRELQRALRNYKYERSPRGLVFPNQKVNIGGVFTHWVERNGEVIQAPESDHNAMTEQGLDHILDVIYSNGSQESAWYLGIFKNNASISGTETAQSKSGITEATPNTDYTAAGGNRLAWTEAGTGNTPPTYTSPIDIDNSASPTTFPILAPLNGGTVYGAFMISETAPANDSLTTSVLNSLSLFGTSRTVATGDDLVVTYKITASDT